MNSTSRQEHSLEEALTAADLKKRNLEIQDLEFSSKASGRILRYIPAISALIGVAGFSFGVASFLIQNRVHVVIRGR